MKQRQNRARNDVVVGFEGGYPKHESREVIADGGGMHIFYRNKKQKVCYVSQGQHAVGEFILEKLLCTNII